MAKGVTTVSLDAELLDLARTRRVNISLICNDALKRFLDIDEEEASDSEKLEYDIKKKETEVLALKTHLKIAKRNEGKREKENKKTIVITDEDMRRDFL